MIITNCNPEYTKVTAVPGTNHYPISCETKNTPTPMGITSGPSSQCSGYPLLISINAYQTSNRKHEIISLPIHSFLHRLITESQPTNIKKQASIWLNSNRLQHYVLTVIFQPGAVLRPLAFD